MFAFKNLERGILKRGEPSGIGRSGIRDLDFLLRRIF
jgi:hypothetical protein